MSLNVERAALRLHRLSFLDEGDEVVIGRTDIDSYGVFPQDGAALLAELQAGRAPVEAAQWYQTTYGQAVDMDGFLDTLNEFAFIREDADPSALAEALPLPVRWQRLGLAMFSAPAWLCYLALVGAAVAVCVGDPRLVPRRHHVFFTNYLMVVELTLLFGQVPLTLLHELFHVLAARRLGLRSSVRLGQRLYFLVFETVLDGLVSVPRRKRYLPMLAGMLADVLVVAGLTVSAAITRHGGCCRIGVGSRLARAPAIICPVAGFFASGGTARAGSSRTVQSYAEIPA